MVGYGLDYNKEKINMAKHKEFNDIFSSFFIPPYKISKELQEKIDKMEIEFKRIAHNSSTPT